MPTNSQMMDRVKRAYDRGDSDAYYGRSWEKPRIWLDSLGREVDHNLTEDERKAYWNGYEDNPSGQKDWGYDES